MIIGEESLPGEESEISWRNRRGIGRREIDLMRFEVIRLPKDWLYIWRVKPGASERLVMG